MISGIAHRISTALLVGSLAFFGPLVAAHAAEHVTDEQVSAAISQVEKIAHKELGEDQVVGLAMAVVHNDQVVYARGFGLREIGKAEKIDPDTVFQLASVSKPISASVIAELVGEGKISWDSKINELDPGFEMFDPWVTRQITIRDFYAHRSGLPEHAGDLLEDYGYDRAQVLYRLRYQHPASSFRSHYAYTNFGITEGAVAAAKAYGLTWEDAAEQKLFQPLGMTSSSARYSDFIARSDRASGHIRANGKWVHGIQRQPDAQSPGGGVSSSLNDMTKWMRMELANGKFAGKQIVDEKALDETRHPHMLTGFNPFNRLPGFYGLGTNVNFDDHGRQKLSHSGGFAMGAATCFTMIPSENLGIIVLTNSYPVGIPEGLAETFIDTVLNGKPSHDWLALYKKVFADPATLGIEVGHDFSKPPNIVSPAAENSAYVGTYKNDFFGELGIISTSNGLAATIGPKRNVFPMKHYDRDVFTYETIGENASGASGITFTMGPSGEAGEVRVEALDVAGEGNFQRAKEDVK